MKITLTTFTVLLAVLCSAQEKSPCKFGKISPVDFQKAVYSIDSNANAVVLADIGSSEIEGNNKGYFSLHYKRYTRIHILNKNGYDAANVEISLYKDGTQEEELTNVKAVTYNLENGKISEVKLDKSNVFKDQTDKKWFVKKFTLPGIKEGSIIEYQYEIVSDFIRNLQPWEFQGGNPVLWSEYNAAIPQFFAYSFLSQGYRPFDIRDSKDRSANFSVTDRSVINSSGRFEFPGMITDNRWVMKNVPALKEENFTSTIRNHISRIEFQLTERRDPLPYENIMGGWSDLAKELLDYENFGQNLNKNNNWLSDIEKPLIAGAKNNLDKARRIFAYVRDNYTCTGHNSLFLTQPLKSIAKSRNGNEAEINLLLTAMFKYADIESDPVILSTRSHGYIYPLYPLLDRFNYVISKAVVDDKDFYFDASVRGLGFGKLMDYCYNGQARIVDKQLSPVELNPDSLKEKKVSSVFLVNDEQGNIKGTLQQTLGDYESLKVRDKIRDKGQEEFVKTVQKTYGDDYRISNTVIDSLYRPDDNLAIKYEITMGGSKDDILYFNPMFGEGYKQNPFKAAERFYPVEMPYTLDEFYTLTMEVPKGYSVDELPKSVRVKLNEQGDGSFEYMIQQQDDRISLRSRIILRRTYFLPEEYDMLREFYNLLVKKQNEQIVFKKKN